MGTPDRALSEAIALFANLGMDGVEIICADDYSCGFNAQTSRAELRAIRGLATDLGLAIAGLVPYAKDMNSAEPQARQAAIAELKRAVDMAEALDCRAIRVFGGHEVQASQRETALGWLAESLRAVGEYAEAAGVQLNIENHMDTMATSAAFTLEIAEAVDLPNVGILYDQANLTFMGQEDHAEAIPLQFAHIRYAHVKDFFWQGEERIAAVLGHGSLPWRQILADLRARGFAGWHSVEYERRWYPDQLPPPEIGMKQCVDYLRGAMA